MAGGTINTEEAFSKAIEVFSELNVTSRDLPGWTRSYVDYISQTSSESFKKECKIDMDITELTVEGQKLTWDALYAQKPNEVYAYKELCDKGDRSSSSYKYNWNTLSKTTLIEVIDENELRHYPKKLNGIWIESVSLYII